MTLIEKGSKIFQSGGGLKTEMYARTNAHGNQTMFSIAGKKVHRGKAILVLFSSWHVYNFWPVVAPTSKLFFLRGLTPR